MKASKENPLYSVAVFCDGKKYDLTSITTDIRTSESENQISVCVKVDMVNIKLKSGKLVSETINGRDRLYIYADDGDGAKEVFRGFVWQKPYREETERKLTIVAYDNLIYWQESEEYAYFSAGKSTKDVASSLCKKWGINLEYTYESITHKKLPLRGTMADIITSDLLDLAKDRTGKKYVIRSEQDTVKIMPVGSNEKVYKIQSSANAISTESEFTMDGIVTQVLILGKEDDDDRAPVEATVSGETDKYGTVKKIISRSENTTLSDAKKEANQILNKNGTPKWTYSTSGVDIPWIRKGDAVEVDAGDITFMCIVTSIDRDISTREKRMSIEMEKA